jgi:trans-aconitate methyltransferase
MPKWLATPHHTPIFTSLVKSQDPKTRILGTDRDPDMVETVEAKGIKNGWKNVEIKVVDSRKL